MELTEFDSFRDLEDRAFGLLVDHMQKADTGSHAVMLAGGRTPLGLYRRLSEASVRVDRSLHIIVSDERYVPEDSPESNYGNMRAMLASLHVSERQVLRAETRLPVAAAAAEFDARLAAFFGNKGTLTLSLLGLGADGHVASLFSARDLERGASCWAIPVNRDDGGLRISVTPRVLGQSRRLIFLAAGPGKKHAVAALASAPGLTTAGAAVQDVTDVEVWYCPAAP